MADTGGIKAQVINMRNNQPVENATVKLSGPVDKSKNTDPNGNFEFSDLPPANNYVLDVSANGFQPEHYEDIVVIENNVTNLWKLALLPSEE